MHVSESSYALLTSPYDSFMQKHLQHYGYFTGRSEVVKKYGFIPSKPQLISSPSGSDSSSCDEEPGTTNERRSAHENSEFNNKSFVLDPRASLRENRLRCGLFLRSQNDESSFEPRWPFEIEVLPVSRIRHIDVPPKQPELFYKPTGRDHMPFVRSCDDNIGRVVFNYNPETCGYFLRSRIGGNRDGCRQAAVKLRSPDDTTVIFESRFESGNLMKVVQIGEFEYELYLRYDLYTKRNTQWFYFRLQNLRTDKRYRFTIVNFFKSTSLYNLGMRPLMYSEHDAQNQGIGWRRWGEEIVYYRNNLTAPENPAQNMFSLTWTCKFPNDNDTYYFAHCYPYTYSDLLDYLNSIQSDRLKSQFCKQKVLCRSLAGNFVYMLTITSPPTTCLTSEQQTKKGVVVTARVHPGETNGSWMMKGLLDFLLGDSADAKLLRDNFIFKIVPMLNPDGVIVGNYRCSLSGRDLNRNYKTVLKDAYPTIWHTREMVKRFMKETELVLYCDFHGHSRKQNVFIYGCDNKHLPKERLKERIFPAMLSKNDPSKFAYYSCKFKVQKQKEGTGRIVMWSMGIKNSYTLESTFCGSTQNDRSGHQFNTRDLESIGYNFLDSILDYSDPDQTKCDRILAELQNELRQAIRMKLLSRGVNLSSLSDIDLDQFSSDGDSSDSGGSDSSVDDGLPKHLEALAAAKARAKKTRKQRNNIKASKDTKSKDDVDKENADKNKPVGLSLTTTRKTQLPNVNDTSKRTNPVTVPRGLESNSDSIRYNGTNETNQRASRWPPITRINNKPYRSSRGDEKIRRSQNMFSTIYGRVNESWNAFITTNIIQQFDSPERDANGNLTYIATASYPLLSTNPRIDEDTAIQTATDYDGELDTSQLIEGNQSDDARQHMANYVTSRLAAHCPYHPAHTPKSPTIPSLQNRTILDIRAIQPPIQTMNPKRVLEQQQHQRQRLMVVFGKQGSAESLDRLNNFIPCPISAPVTDRNLNDISFNHDESSATISKLVSKQSDAEPINIVFRYEPSASQQSTSQPRVQTVRTANVKKSGR